MATLAAVAVFSLVAVACGDADEVGDPGSLVDTVTGTTAADHDSDTPPSSSTPDSRTPRSGGTLTVAIETDPPGLNPHLDAWGHDGHVVARTIFDSLAAYDDEGNVQPYLAKSITANDDATVWTISLRPGIEFHNGEPLDAAAVAKNFETARESPAAGETLTPLDSVRIIDDLTVELTMTEPWGSFPAHLTGTAATQFGYVAAPAMLDDPDGSRHPIGTGPFVFEEWTRDDLVTVTRNDGYWQDPPHLDQVDLRIVPDPNNRFNALRNGDLDLVYTANAGQISELLDREANGDAHVVVADPSDPDVIALNTTQPPLDDMRVRRALAMAIDTDRVLDVLNASGEKTAMTGPYPPSSYWYTETDYPTYDPDAATDLIDEYTSEHGPVSFDYLGSQSPVALGLQELIQSMWADVGVDANIISAPQAEIVSAVFNGDYGAVGWGGLGSGDPDDDYGYFHSGEVINISGFESPVIDDAMEAGRATADPTERKEHYDVVQHELADQVPYLWLTSNEWAVATGANVQGLEQLTLPDGDTGRITTGPRISLHQLWIS